MIHSVIAFSSGQDGDMRGDLEARHRFSDAHQIPGDWATVTQAHGADVLEVSGPGHAGSADAIFTTSTDTPVAIFTADCLGVAVVADGGVGVAHAGWRGAAQGVVTELVRRMRGVGLSPIRAQFGPAIGACCFEVGPEVAARFPDQVSETSWGTVSVGIAANVAEQLDDIPVQQSFSCTYHESEWFSHRRDSDSRRMATVAALIDGANRP